MSGGRKRSTPRATHAGQQPFGKVPGRDVDGLNTKAGRQREKAVRTAAKKAAKARAATPTKAREGGQEAGEA